MSDDPNIYKCPVTGGYYDPLDVHRKLLVQSKGEINRWIADQRGADEVLSATAEEKIISVARVALKLPEVDFSTGNGVTSETVLRALDFFIRWLEAKKVKGQPSQTGSPCADCPQS